MTPTDAAIAPAAALIDKVVTDASVRDAAKLALLRPETAPDLERLRMAMAAIAGDAAPSDRWTGRARPSFLYVMYALLLWSMPMGIVAAFRPAAARAIASAMTAYLGGLPEPLYALFGTGYLGYTVAREWGKAKGP